MSNIRIDPDTMHARAAEYRQEAEQIGQVIAKMDVLLNNLQSEWEGEASRSYAERYQSDFRPALLRTQEMIKEIGLSLDRTSVQMHEHDVALATNFRQGPYTNNHFHVTF